MPADKNAGKKLIESLQKELDFYKSENSKMSNTLKKFERDDQRTKLIIEKIAEKNIRLPKVSQLKVPAVKGDEEIAILHLSDIHSGERITSEEMGGMNEYNLDIMQNRLLNLESGVAKIHSIITNSYPIRELRVYGMGDFISGIIHDELVETADGDVTDWLFVLATAVSKMLVNLSSRFERIKFVGVIGNHGRMKKKVYFKRRYVNWDYICYKTIELMCKDNPKISFVIPKSFFYLDKVFNYNYLIMHGDDIKSWAGIPFYGIQRAISRFQEMFGANGKFIDYMAIAHFHNSGSLQKAHGELLLNGSLIGGNEFSVGALQMSNEPYQLLLGMHPRKGITFKYELKVK